MDFIEDDVRLGGAVADTGPQAGQRGVKIEKLVKKNRGKKRTRAKGR